MPGRARNCASFAGSSDSRGEAVQPTLRAGVPCRRHGSWPGIALVGLLLGVSGTQDVLAQVAQNLPSVDGDELVLEGSVLDVDGRGIAMARLTLSTRNTPSGQKAFSDDDGRFFFYRLNPGTYSLAISAGGFETITRVVDLNFGPQQLRIVLNRMGSGGTPVGEPAVRTDELKIPVEVRRRYEKARKLLDDGEAKKAVKELEEALEAYPEFAAAHDALGIGYLQLQDYEKAEAAFQQALGLREELGEAHLGLGLIENERKAYPAAEIRLLRARELLPDDWRVHYELGRSLYHQDRWEEAEATLVLGRTLNPGYGNLRILLANTFALLDKLPEALQEMRAFLEVAPRSPLAKQVREKVKALEAELDRTN